DRKRDFFRQRRGRDPGPARKSVFRASVGLWRTGRVGVSVRPASGARGSGGSGADYGRERIGKEAGLGGEGAIRARRRIRSSLLRASRASVGIARASRRARRTGALGRRGSSARGVLVSDNSNLNRGADAGAAGGVDSAWRAAALERLPASAVQVTVGEGVRPGCAARLGASPDLAERGRGNSRTVSARRHRTNPERSPDSAITSSRAARRSAATR